MTSSPHDFLASSPAQVSITSVLPASVVVTVRIMTSEPSIADQAAVILSTTSATQLSADLGVTVEAVSGVGVTQTAFTAPSPPPPSPPPPSPPPHIVVIVDGPDPCAAACDPDFHITLYAGVLYDMTFTGNHSFAPGERALWVSQDSDCPSINRCDSWCEGHSSPDSVKCAWSTQACAGCGFCNRCENWCDGHSETTSSVRCGWDACSGCDVCSIDSTLQLAVEIPAAGDYELCLYQSAPGEKHAHITARVINQPPSAPPPLPPPLSPPFVCAWPPGTYQYAVITPGEAILAAHTMCGRAVSNTPPPVSTLARDPTLLTSLLPSKPPLLPQRKTQAH